MLDMQCVLNTGNLENIPHEDFFFKLIEVNFFRCLTLIFEEYFELISFVDKSLGFGAIIEEDIII